MNNLSLWTFIEHLMESGCSNQTRMYSCSFVPKPPDEIVQGVPGFLLSLPVHAAHKACAPRVVLAGENWKHRDRGGDPSTRADDSVWARPSPFPPPCVSRLHSLVFHPWAGRKLWLKHLKPAGPSSLNDAWIPWVSQSFLLLLKGERDPFALAKITIWSQSGKLWMNAYVSHLKSGNHLIFFLLLLQVTSIQTSIMVCVRPATVTQWEQLDKCVL